MCGITGWISFDRDLTGAQPTVDAMTKTMACRGPDAAGTWAQLHAALGHRRLAVIDLPGGVQPMSTDTSLGTVVIVYSGEVYNFKELRHDLIQQGHTFATNSDTEVVLKAYVQWGACVGEYLNGMYAFAIWDERDSTLTLVRDRMGIKPLYYYKTPDGALFGSEPKAIMANSLAKTGVNIESLYNIFLDTRAPGRTPWVNIHEVQPGTVVTVNAHGIKSHTYWSLPTFPHLDNQETTINIVRELMSDIVRRQLVADVPHCVLLSGGLDSSAISAFAAAHLTLTGDRLRTFSLDPTKKAGRAKPEITTASRDSQYAEDVARLIQSDHRNVYLDAHQIADQNVRRTLITARDMPTLGQMDASLYLLSKAIRTSSTVALSGESSDEVFGGYPWFHNGDALTARTFPWSVANRAPLYSPTALAAILVPELAHKLDIDQRTADQYSASVSKVEHLETEDDFDRRVRVASNLALTRHVRMLLERKDRMSMAVGLEVRVPFCDHRLVEYVYNIPWALKSFDGREKSVLRHATKHLLPKSVVNRRKSAFPAIDDPSYPASLQQQAKDLLTEHSHDVFDFLDRNWLQETAQLDPLTCSRKVSSELNLALDLYHWLEIYRPRLDLSTR